MDSVQFICILSPFVNIADLIAPFIEFLCLSIETGSSSFSCIHSIHLPFKNIATTPFAAIVNTRSHEYIDE